MEKCGVQLLTYLLFDLYNDIQIILVPMVAPFIAQYFIISKTLFGANAINIMHSDTFKMP